MLYKELKELKGFFGIMIKSSQGFLFVIAGKCLDGENIKTGWSG